MWVPLISLTLPMIPQQVQAADTDTSAPIEFVTVSATRGASQQDIDESTTTLSSTQIEEAPETGVDQIVNKIPGIFTPEEPGSELHPTGQPFSIRGFGTSTNINTLLMIDGIPANDAYFRTIDWGQIPKDSIESIEVIRGGGASSLWGDLAMGGIVNVVTKPPTSGGIIDLSGGGFDAENAQASVGGQVTETLAVGFDLGISDARGYNQTPVQYRNPYMDSTISGTQDYQATADFTPSTSTKFYLTLMHHRITEDGLVWNIARNSWETDRVAGGGSLALPDLGSLNFTSWYGQGEMFTQNASNASYTIFSPLSGVPYISQTETVTYHHIGGSFFFNGAWGPFKDINIGVDARNIWAYDPINLFSATAQTGTLIASAKHQFQGLFAQGTWRSDAIPIQLTLGLREDFWQATNASINGNFKGSSFSDTVPNQSYDHFDPRLGLKYQLPSGVDIRGAVYEDFAAPGMNQMYRSFISGSNYTTYDASLAPQTNFGRELGIDVNEQSYQISATVYDNSLRNFIDYATVESGCALANNYCGTGIAGIAGGTLRQYVNAGNATLKGFEIIGGWKILDTLSLTTGASATDAYLTSSRYTTPSAGVIPDPVRQQLGQTPKWTITSGLDWQATAQLKLIVTMKSFPDYWNNTSHTQLNSAATIFDAGASFQLLSNLDLYVVAQNIFGKTYYDQGLGYTTTNGTTALASTIPALGIPFNVTGGLRVAF